MNIKHLFESHQRILNSLLLNAVPPSFGVLEVADNLREPDSLVGYADDVNDQCIKVAVGYIRPSGKAGFAQIAANRLHVTVEF